MEYDRIHEQAALHSAVTPLNSQGIINDILKISLEPFLFQELLERILSYIVSRKQLRLAGRGAIFLIDPDSERLILKASLGLTDQQRESCANATFRECHCGMAASSGTIHFFSQSPPRQSPCSPATGYKSHYCVPILHDATAVGVLTLYVAPDHELSVNMEQLLESIANILATVIESQKMDQQLIELVNDLRVSIINLREEKLFTESVIQSLNHGLLVVDMQGVILKSNPMSRQILQPFARNLDGRNLHELLGWETARRMLLIPAEGEARRERDVILQAQSGESRVVSCVTTSRQDTRGRQVGVIIAVTDVTELRYVHKEMEKMNRLSTVAEIASAVAHEVRNPLAGIKIMAQSIEEDATDGEQLECSRRIIRQVDRLNEILTEFFSYARPVIPNRRPTSLHDIIHETRPLLGNKLVKSNIELANLVPPDLPSIIADPNQMQQVFLNLLLNAIDAIRQDGRIEIRARTLDGEDLAGQRKSQPGLLPDKRYVLVEFRDNGAGMPADIAEKVFEPFFTTKSNGTGLGLSIVYRTLHENDASITVSSAPGKGSTFSMYFEAGH